MLTIKDVKARYYKGSLIPLQQTLDIKEGEVVTISIEVEEPEDRAARIERDREATKRSAGGWKGQYDDHEELIRMLYQARLDGSRKNTDFYHNWANSINTHDKTGEGQADKVPESQELEGTPRPTTEV